MNNMSETNKRIGQMKKNYPDFWKTTKARFTGFVLALFALMLLPMQLKAEMKDAKVTVPYLQVEISDFEYLVESGQSILPSSLPIAVAKFTRTVTKKTVEVSFKYDDASIGSTALYQLTGDQPFPSGMLSNGNPATFNNFKGNITVSGTTFSYSQYAPPIQIINADGTTEEGYKYNQFRLEFMHLVTNDQDLTNGSKFIKNVDLYSNKPSKHFGNVAKSFTHEAINEGRIERLATITWAADSSKTIYNERYCKTISVQDLDTDYSTNFSNTEIYWVAIRTMEVLESGASKTANGVTDGFTGSYTGGSEDTRFRLNMGLKLWPYCTNPTASTPGGLKDRDSIQRYEDFAKNMIVDAETVDLTPFPNYIGDYWTSVARDVMGIWCGSNHAGFPSKLFETYINSQVKYYTVNGPEFYQPVEGGTQVQNSNQAFIETPDTANPELMPLNEPYPVLGLNLAGRKGDEGSAPECLAMVTVQINVPAGSSFNPNRDLSNDISAKYPGISIWYDADNNGRFDKEKDKLLDPQLNIMNNEVISPVWEDTGSGSTYTVNYIIKDSDKNAKLELVADGKPDFFICLTAKPNANVDLEQPRYGSSFTMQVNDVHFYYKDNADADGNPLVDADPSWGFANPPYFDGTSYTPYSGPFQNIFGDIGPYGCDYSKEVTIGFAVKPYHQPDHIEAEGFPVPVLAFNMVASPDSNVTETLHSVKVRFASGFNPNKLAPLSDNYTSGVSLWADDKTGSVKNIGVFDPRTGTSINNFASFKDSCVPLAASSLKWFIHSDTTGDRQWDGVETPTGTEYFYVLLTPKTAIQLKDDDYFYKYDDSKSLAEGPAYGSNRGMDYFICLRGGEGLAYGDAITVSVVPAEDFEFGRGSEAVYSESDARKNSQTKDAISNTVQATMPTFFSEPSSDHRLKTDSYTAVLGIDVVAPDDGASYSFNHFAFQIIDEKNANGDYTFSFSDYVDSGMTGADSGIALYKDNGDGIFDEKTDTRVKFKLNGTVETKPFLSTQTFRNDEKLYLIEMELDADSVGDLPTSNTGLNAGVDYFLVMRPSRNADPGDSFKIQLWGSDLLGTADDTISYLKRGNYSRSTANDGTDSHAWKHDDTGLLLYTDKDETPKAGTTKAYNDEKLKNFEAKIASYDSENDSIVIGTNPLITYKRFKSSQSYKVATISNDDYSNLVAKGQVIEPATPQQLSSSTNTAIPAIGIRVNDPLGEATLNKVRIYFDSDNGYDPAWLLNPITNSITDGIQIWKGNRRLDVISAKWRSDFKDGMVIFDRVNGWQAPEEQPDALETFEIGDKLVWYDADKNGVWSSGDALWIAATITDVNKSKFDSASDTILVGQPLDGTLGTVVTTSTYGFTWADIDGSGGFNEDSDCIFYTGSGRTALSYYLDLQLLTPATLDTEASNTPAFKIYVRANDAPQIFGIMRFNLSLLANGVTYSTGYSSASANISTELISFKSQTAVVSNFNVRRGNKNFVLTWNVPEGDNRNIVIIRKVCDDDSLTDTEVFTGYPVNQTYYESDLKKEQIYAYEATGAAGAPDEGFTKDTDNYYILTGDYSDARVVYVGKGEEVDSTTRTLTDGQEIVDGKYYYYMVFAADVTNTKDQGTPNSVSPSSSKTTDAASILRDQMIEANPWGIKAVTEMLRPEDVTDLKVEAQDKQIGLTWANPVNYTNGTLLDADKCKIIILRRVNKEIDNGLLQDANGYAVGDKLGSDADVDVIAILEATKTSYIDTGLTDISLHYYYEVYAYYAGEGEADYNYSLIPAKGDANPLDLGTLTAYPASITTLKGTYDKDAQSVTLTWAWAEGPIPKLVIARSTSMISNVYPMQGSTYTEGQVLAEGVTIIKIYSGNSTSYIDTTATGEGVEAYYYAVYSYDASAGIYNPTQTQLGELTGRASLEANVNMCGVSTTDAGTIADLEGYIYNASGEQTLNDSDDDGKTNYYELSGNEGAAEVTDPKDPYSPLIPRSLDLATGSYAYAQVSNFTPPHAENRMLEFWFNIKTLNTQNCTIIRNAQRGTGKVDEFKVEIENNNTLKYTFLTTATNFTKTATFQLPGTMEVFEANVWYHVAIQVSPRGDTSTNVRWVVYKASDTPVVYNATNVELAGVADLTSKTTDLIIGEADSLVVDKRLKFYIDEIRFWNTIKSDDFIRDNRNVTIDKNTSGLTAYYRFDDGGFTAEDYKYSFAGFDSLDDLTKVSGKPHLNRAMKLLGQNGGTTGKALFSTDVAVTMGVEAEPYADTDNDGIPDWWEQKYFGNLTTAGYASDGSYTDFDKDGLNDYYEYLAGTSPIRQDTDGNGTTDANENGDGDGLTNLEEQKWGTRPDVADSDDDGITDDAEVTAGTSPLHSMSPAVPRSFKLASLNGTLQQQAGMQVPLTTEESAAGLSSWTVEAWINPGASAVTGVLFKRIVNEKTAFEVGLNASKLYVYTECQDGSNANCVYPAALPASQWTHVAVAWDPGSMTMNLVINGVSRKVFEYESEPVNFWSDWTDTTVHIGGGEAVGSYEIYRNYTLYMFQNPTDWADDVLVDEVRIWDEARAISDIFATKDTLIGRKEALTGGLMRCYRFDDGGDTVEDFAHPGWKNFAAYAMKPSVANWYNEADAVSMYGIDDSNNNGMPDWFEAYYKVSDATADADGDGLINLYEYLCGTNPTDRNNGTADYDAMSADGQLTNAQKQMFGLDPRLADSDGDGISDFDEINGTAETFPKGAQDTDTAADPLNPLNNKKPENNPLKHFVFTGDAEGMALKAADKYALESWTVMAWVNADSADQTASIIRRQVSDNGVTFELGLESGVPCVKYVTENNATVQAPQSPASATLLKLEAGKWAHLAGTFDNETGVLRLYVNGMPVAETVEEKKRADFYGTGVIGGELVGAKVAVGAGFTGKVDDIQIYAGAVDGSVISDIYYVMESGTMGIAASYAPEAEEGGDAVNMAMSAEQLLSYEHIGNQLLVKFADTVSEEMIERAHAMLGTKTLKYYPQTGIYLIEVPENLNLKSGIEKLRQMNAIEFVEPNYKVQSTMTPNDPKFNQLWGMKNSSYNGVDVGAAEMWDVSTGSNKVVVAVIDTGIQYDHPDLKDNMWVNAKEIPDNGIDDDNNGYVDDVYGYDFVNQDGDPMDDHSHGTHCAGTIGAVGNNGEGVVGVNWNVKLMALKVLASNGYGSDADIVSAIEYAVAKGVDVISMSLGSYGYSASELRALRQAQAKGILVVAAAGNDTNDNDIIPNYPSNYELDNIIAVASMDRNGNPSSFTNYGKTSVDIAAPGGNILSTVPGSDYGTKSGTSMATPHVSGMAALLKAMYPKSNYKQLRKAILNGYSKGSSEWKDMTVTGGFAYLPKAYAQLQKSSGGHGSASGLVACFRGNAVFGGKALDLTETELGAAAAGIYGAAPTVGRYAADWNDTDETDLADYVNFNGDSDGDGMPNWYEVLVSHNPNEADGELDSDKDGLTNYFEYLAGTSPWNTMTDGATQDAERTIAFGDITYADAQRTGINPKAETAGYEDQDTDDDGLTDKDESGNGDAGVIAGRADDSLTPYVNRVLKISKPAGSYLSLPNQARYVLNENWSVDMWINVDRELVDSASKAVLIKRTVDTKAAGNAADTIVNYEVGIKQSGNYWAPYASFKMAGGATKECVAYNGIAAEVWAHVGAVYSTDEEGNGKLDVYVNGKLDRSLDCGEVEMNGDQVGLSEVRVGEGFLGFIEGLRIWNVAKDDFDDSKSAADDALEDYVPSGLKASFIFDDGGVTAQNFAVAQDDWKEGWKNAATLVKVGEGIIEMVASDNSPVEGDDKDSDGDGLPDWWEKLYGLDPEDATGDNGADGDPDGDGLTNYNEYQTWNSEKPIDPKNPRTYEPLTDGEVDSDGDGLANAMEVQYGTNPGKADTDDDGLTDYEEVIGPASADAGQKTGPLDPLAPVVWRALKGNGTADDVLVIPEHDRVLGHDEKDSLSKDWTIEAWFMPSGDNLTGSLIRRAGKDAKGELCYYFDLGLIDGKPYVRASMQNQWITESGPTNLAEIVGESGIQATKNLWTHYAATWDATKRTLTIYVNGTYSGSAFVQGAPLIDGGASSTGFTTEILAERKVGDEAKYLAGYIDEVRVWTDTEDGRKGLRLGKQISQLMARVPALKNENDALTNFASLPTAYYRFDDGGKYAEDFSYTVAEERDNNWPHSLYNSNGEITDLHTRMLSSWKTGDSDAVNQSGAKWEEANASERAICMNGSGEADLDPIPNGWKQVYWPEAQQRFGVIPGEGYDFNQYFALTNSYGSRSAQDDPEQFPGEGSSFVHPITGEIKGNNIHHTGDVNDAYVYFTDLYFDNTPSDLNVTLTWGLNTAPGAGNNITGVNEIFIFVNGRRVGFSSGSTGGSGEDITNNLYTHVNGQSNFKGSYGYNQSSTSAAISGSIDIGQYMSKGRNRITILANHTDYSTSSPHPYKYDFTARVRADGKVPGNKLEGWDAHVRWFWSRQKPWTSGGPGTFACVDPFQETEAICHTLEADGSNKLLFWFEKYYAIYPWGFDQDPDGDGLTNWTEYLANSNPLEKDGDGDGRTDADMDFDGDGLFNSVEQTLGTMPNMGDTDDDGQSDYYEANNGTSPLNGQDAFQKDNLVLDLNGKYVLTVNETGDEGAQEELSSWTLQTWFKLHPDQPAEPSAEPPAEPPATTSDKQIILRRTTGRYNVGDISNYELGVTEEGLPYAGFTVINEDNTKITNVFAIMKQTSLPADFNFKKGEWYQITAVFNAPNENAQNGYIALYLFNSEGKMASYVRNNVSVKPSTTVTGIGGITIGGKQPGKDETMDGTKILKDAFVGYIDNLAIWNVAFTEAQAKARFNSLATLVSDSSVFNYYCLKFAPYTYRVSTELVHAYLFDDGGQSIEDVAVKNDWYNGHVHALSAPLIDDYAVYEVEPTTVIKKDAQGREIYDADNNPVYETKPKEGVTNLLCTDDSREEQDSKDSDGDGMPDWWETLYGLDPNNAADAADDEDGDGLCNLYEFLSGTNPLLQITEDDNVMDGARDADEDGIPNLDEQDLTSRPDKKDTDDDGFDDGKEAGYPDALYLTSPVLSLQQPKGTNEAPEGVATTADMARILRLDGTNTVTVTDNADHSGNSMTVMFWLRAGMQENGKIKKPTTEAPAPVELPSERTCFLGRTVANGNYNYMFYISKNGIEMSVSKKSASASGPKETVVFEPTGGIVANEWYLVAGVIDLTAATPYIYLHCFSKDSTDTSAEYVCTSNKHKFSTNNTNVSAEGKLLIGAQGSKDAAMKWQANLVLDIDNLTIWTEAKSAAVLKAATGSNSTSITGFSENMASRFTFDDGGETCEDSCHGEDWWNDWKYAATMSEKTVEEVTDGDVKTVGKGMIKDASLNDMDKDSDHDGLLDAWEIYFFGSLKYSGSDDPDNDGMTNKQEYTMSEDFRAASVEDLSYGNAAAWLSPNDPDTDGDGMPDGWEFLNELNPLDPSDATGDKDEDQLENLYEYIYGTNPADEDTDGDGLPDGWEVKYMFVDANGNIEDPSMDPLNASGKYGANGDPDGDGIRNIDEYTYGSDPTIYDSPDKDSDGDKLTDNEERAYSTDPQLTDTDDDEYDDYVEMTASTEGYNSQSKTSIKEGSGFAYEGNLVAQIMKAKGGKRGCLTVPNAGDPSRLGFGSWTIEARVRLRSINKEAIAESKEIYIIRRSFSRSVVADNASNEGTSYKRSKEENDGVNDESKNYYAWENGKILIYTSDPAPTAGTVAYSDKELKNAVDKISAVTVENENTDNAKTTAIVLPLFWNYALGLRLEPEKDKVYPFVSWKAPNCIERRVNSNVAKSDVGMNLVNEPSEDSTYQTAWTFISGSYDASTQTLSLYIDGEKVRTETISAPLSANEQCPVDEAKIGEGYKAYLKFGENFDLDDPAKMLLDEVRVWGVQPGTVETSNGYISNYTRSDDEIASGVLGPVAPAVGVYDSAIGDRYTFSRNSDSNYLIDTRVSDSAWNTSAGTVGTSVRVYYEDRNHNNKWDPEEDIWRDRTLAQAEAEDGVAPASGAKAVTGSYDEGVDVRLAWGNSWQCGTAYSYVSGQDSSGKDITVNVSANDSLVGRSMNVYYNDLNGNGVIEYNDNFWIDYTEESTNKYVAEQSDWAKRMGLVLYYRFDDGGGSMEDYVWHSDWRSTPVWRHAIRPAGLEGTWPPAAKAKGGKANGGYQYVTEEDGDHFAWVINAIESPSKPDIEIQTLSDVRDEQTHEIKFCYRPANDSDDKTQYDLLTAAIIKEAADPEGGTVTYKYWWLDSTYYKKNATNETKLYVDGDLKYDGTLVPSTPAVDSLPDDALVSTEKELDLYNKKKDIAVGAKLQLAVVAISSTGKYSDVTIRNIEVTSLDGYKPPTPFGADDVKFTASSTKEDAASDVTYVVPGSDLEVEITMTAGQFSAKGKVIVEWYKNGVLYQKMAKEAGSASTLTFTLEGTAEVKVKREDGKYDTITKDITEKGSVWSYKAYYIGEDTEDEVLKRSHSSRSRAVPPVGTVTGDFDYKLVGAPCTMEVEDETQLAGNKPPTTPTSITFTPSLVDENTIIVASAHGSKDPNGDSFSYFYEWYIDGELQENENMPIFPYQDGTRTLKTTKTTTGTDGTTTTETTTTKISKTSINEGDRITCRAYAVDIYGAKSGVRVSNTIIVQEELEDGAMDMEALAYEYNNTWQTATRLLPKEDWTDPDDDFTQEHYFYEANDVDWFYFVVPQTQCKLPKLVKFETNAGDNGDYGGMYNSMHMREYDFVDTMATLYRLRADGKLERILHVDDYGSITGRGGTKYARFEKELKPGEYYVCVSLADKTNFSVETPYFVHLGIEEVSNVTPPTTPEYAVLSPSSPGVMDDLVCDAGGSYNAGEGNITYHYVWYRNDMLVPFGTDSTIDAWETDRWLINQSKNHTSGYGGKPNVMPKDYTLPGQKWYVVVYAEDKNGFSEGFKSNTVIIESSSWDMQIGVTKTYTSGIGSVEWDDQKVTLGWRANATFGFDSALDSSIMPGVNETLALGRMYSVGFDNTHGMLSTDMRPYGQSSSWFIMVEAGDDSIDSMTLSWNGADMVPMDSMGGLTITRMYKDASGVFEPVAGTTKNMADENKYELTEEDLAELQVDKNGQRYVVFRVSLGAPDSMQLVQLNKGWNMVSLNVTPLNNGVDDVFAAGSTKYYSGTVYEYNGGQYVPAKNIIATKGYWVYSPNGADFVVYGDLETTGIRLNKGWNIVGPVYNIDNFKTTYPDYLKIVDPDKISEFINKSDGTSEYKPIKDSGYSMYVGKAYWINSEKEIVLPVIPSTDK